LLNLDTRVISTVKDVSEGGTRVMILAALITGSQPQLEPYLNKIGLQRRKMGSPDGHYGPELGRALQNACVEVNTVEEDHGRAPEETLRVAASRMYLAKQSNGNCVKVASPNPNAHE